MTSETHSSNVNYDGAFTSDQGTFLVDVKPQARSHTSSNLSVRERQAPLRAQYKSSPAAAQVTDRAKTTGADASDPFHSIVEPMPGCGAILPVGVHRAVGGMHDAPTPGDILCAALAACQDSTVRMVANLLGIELEFVAVEVTADVDVRGTMMVEQNVPVGFQAIRCKVQLRAKAGTNPKLLEQLGSVLNYANQIREAARYSIA